MAATITLTERATERGTFVIDLAFFDENSDPVIPTSASWKLTGQGGEVINGRSAVAITPAETVSIALSGDDLDMLNGSFRAVTVEALYDSSLGTGLILRAEIRFSIENLQGV